MSVRLKVFVLSLCLLGVTPFMAQAEDGPANDNGEAKQLRQDIEALRKQAEPLKEQLKAIHDKIKADREKLQQLRGERKEHREHRRQEHQDGTKPESQQ